ncbi:MAG: 1,4-alpha-glucan branching protein GlgB, partial [Firmicutes bacterium]|nr:1,4-alpha-glucan branching protein GlgB [Bacillota bacterium]
MKLNEYVEKFHQGEMYDAYKFMGCVFDEKTGNAVFRTWAPHADSVSVIGEFNDWDENKGKMEPDGSGLFSLAVGGVKTFDAYKFVIHSGEQTIYKADPYAVHAEKNGNCNSKAYDLSRVKINDAKYFSKLKNKDIYNSPMSIYEAHIGSWRLHDDGNVYSYRDFADAIVPYLKKMKFTHLELMGVAEHPFDGSWGYQIINYYAPTSRYGTPEDFGYLVEKLHAAGIGIIIDWVPGHFSKDQPGLIDFDGQPLYEPSIEPRKEFKEWGTRCFDYGKGEVQTFLCSNAMMWMDVYHVDGLRVDAVASMLYLDYGRGNDWLPNRHGGRENEEAVAFLQKLNTYVFAHHPKAMMIAEESTAWPKVTKPVAEGGLGFNFKWNMGWMNDTLSYAKTDPVFRSGLHNNLTFSLTYAFSENYILPVSHDEVVHGKCSLLSKMPGDYGMKFAGWRNYLMSMFAHPGKKLIFMGTEFAQFIEWNFEQQLDWMLLDYPMHEESLEFFAALNEFYVKTPAMWKLDCSFDGFEWLVVDD